MTTPNTETGAVSAPAPAEDVNADAVAPVADAAPAVAATEPEAWDVSKPHPPVDPVPPGFMGVTYPIS